jgi:hypothetical protein
VAAAVRPANQPGSQKAPSIQKVPSTSELSRVKSFCLGKAARPKVASSGSGKEERRRGELSRKLEAFTCSRTTFKEDRKAHTRLALGLSPLLFETSFT